ncbi:MAG: ATP-dependent DNA helicase RecG [Nocardioides sp.]
MISIDSPIETVLGDKSAKRKKFIDGLGVRTVGDLLAHHPRRYLKTGELTRLDHLVVGQLISVVGEIAESAQHTYRDRRTGRTAYRHDIVVSTDGPSLRISFFAQSPGVAAWNVKRLSVGGQGVFTGQVGRFRDDWQLTNPAMVLFGGDDLDPIASLPPLYPIYPLTKGVDTQDVQRAVRFARSVLDRLPELLPAGIRSAFDLPDARTALAWIHEPETLAQAAAAQRRYRFEEALITQLVLARRRAELATFGTAAREGRSAGLVAAFDKRMPFTLTDGQRQVSQEIFDELARPHPMNRLLQGEVGSGKTVVALRAMLQVVDSGGQAALLAPTEVLAQQHYRSIVDLLGELGQAMDRGGMLGGAVEGTTVSMLTGSMPQPLKRRALVDIASGQAGIVIGTHALLEDRVTFADLGLVVVDEQHRFGVEQRAALTDKASSPPHVLVMTATPIPRSVAMTIFGDLEVSTLIELPAGRADIQTNVVPIAEQPHWIERVWERIREEIERGHQAYIVCPRISGDLAESGMSDRFEADQSGADQSGADQAEVLPLPGAPVTGLTAVDDLAPYLTIGPLAGLRVAALHGRMSGDDKDRVMRSFASAEVDVLVSTTVIEVGVDVANATMMVIMDADRFGISQLHQLRGRVGRGGLPGLCLLVTSAASGGRERLDAVAATTDGFVLSRVDLEQRREGDVLGAAQSGFRSGLQTLRVLRDEQTIVAARTAAMSLIAEDPELTATPELAAAVLELERSSASEFMEKS